MIKILDKTTADKIAAGEVIERPISIIKELVENSIDAGSTSITIEIKNGGKSYIRVTDNGSGIEKTDVETAFLRHATSKIDKASDLNNILSLGFRGEALASIAAVSRTELITKTKDDSTGTRLVIHGGQQIIKESVGAPDGTTFVITDLFFNTPARLKFLKADNAESNIIISFISEIALCYQSVKFRFINNEKVIFTTLGDGNRLGTIQRIYPDIDTKNLISIDNESDGMKITGYISSPAMNRNNRGSQIYFVNGRVINSKIIEKAIDIGYKERLFEGRYPIAYLFIEVSPARVDVNIHPNKREVRFDDENGVIDFISQSIVKALSQKEAIVDAGNVYKETKNISNPAPFKSQNHIKTEEKQVDIKQLLSTIPNEVKPESKYEEVKEVEIQYAKNGIFIEKPTFKPFDFRDLTITGAIFNTYLTAFDDNSFYLIDQHACQERIFYEKLVSEYDNLEKVRQTLLIPYIINVSNAVCELEEKWLKQLLDMGFSISNFGQNSYRIEEIPMFMSLNEAENFVHDFVNNFQNSIDLRNKVVIDKLIMASCKAAIKAHDKLSMEEMKALLKDLSNCINPYSCPHGRPTVIRLTQYEIEKMFKRV